MSKIKDLQGKRFGKLKVLEYAGLNKHNGALWIRGTITTWNEIV